eukprot:430135-Rhodomonas_salina.1
MHAIRAFRADVREWSDFCEGVRRQTRVDSSFATQTSLLRGEEQKEGSSWFTDVARNLGKVRA